MYFTLAKLIWSFIFPKPRPIIELLKLHFARSPAKFPIISATFKQSRQPCISQAFRASAQTANRKCVLVGISTYDASLRFSYLMHPDRSEQQREGPVRFGDVTLAGGQSLSFAAQELYLIKDKDQNWRSLLQMVDDSMKMF